MLYVDLNMVRAGVVAHPSEWPFCGYHEIQNPRKRYSLIDYDGLIDLFRIGSREEFKEIYKGWVAEALDKEKCLERDSRWTECIAVGSEGFVRDVKEKLGPKAGSYELRETTAAYEPVFDGKKGGLRQKNAFVWDISI